METNSCGHEAEITVRHKCKQRDMLSKTNTLKLGCLYYNKIVAFVK